MLLLYQPFAVKNNRLVVLCLLVALDRNLFHIHAAVAVVVDCLVVAVVGVVVAGVVAGVVVAGAVAGIVVAGVVAGFVFAGVVVGADCVGLAVLVWGSDFVASVEFVHVHPFLCAYL